MHNKFYRIGIGIFCGLLVWASFLSCRSKDSSETIRILQPQMGNIRKVVSSPGTVMPKVRLEIKPPVNGRIDQVLVREGDRVKSGDIVAWMSSTDRAALIDAARGQSKSTDTDWQKVYKAIALIAPMDGEVIVSTVQSGETVTTNDPVVVLSDRLIVRAQVDETDIGQIKLNQTVVVSLDAYADVKINAVVNHIYYESKTVNNVTVYEVDLSLETVPDFFRSGMNTNADFLVETKDNVLVVPLEIIQRKQDKNFVTVKEAKTNEILEREVTLGLADDKNVEVLTGLSLKDEIIIKDQKYTAGKKTAGTNPFLPNRGGNRR